MSAKDRLRVQYQRQMFKWKESPAMYSSVAAIALSSSAASAMIFYAAKDMEMDSRKKVLLGALAITLITAAGNTFLMFKE